jgi:hypothetical protein
MTEKALTFKKSGSGFSIIGGTYIEVCEDPAYYELYGSGLRAALALSTAIPDINFKTCVAEEEMDKLLAVCTGHQIIPTITPITSTITFAYMHPLKKPVMYPELNNGSVFELSGLQGENVLYYGMAEAIVPVNAKRLVYDPQSLMRFSDTKSTAEHLALILNKKEARYFCRSHVSDDIEEMGAELRSLENAQVVVIKDGSQGAWVFDEEGITHVPVFQTNTVWPIGSGDIFSAVFAWQWMHNGKPAKEAALTASKFTATYCSTRLLPLPLKPLKFTALKPKGKKNKIYLAGPFFTQSERWLIQELKDALEDFGNEVFSPFHDVGVGFNYDEIAKADLKGLEDCSAMLAVVSGLDTGTIFEIGYARAKRKKVIIFVENVRDEDLLMLKGSGCHITSDLSTAIYKASW